MSKYFPTPPRPVVHTLDDFRAMQKRAAENDDCRKPVAFDLTSQGFLIMLGIATVQTAINEVK